MQEGTNLPASAQEQLERSGGLESGGGSGGVGVVGSSKLDSHLYIFQSAAMFRSPDSVQLLYSLWTRKPTKPTNPHGLHEFAPAPPMERSASANANSFEKMSDDYVCISEEFMVGLTAQVRRHAMPRHAMPCHASIRHDTWLAAVWPPRTTTTTTAATATTATTTTAAAAAATTTTTTTTGHARRYQPDG